MKVSVVIPALNEEKTIAQTVAQVPLRQLNFLGYYAEVVVVDNGSTDRTVEFAKRAGAKVVATSRPGYGEALQVGFAAAVGDIIITGDANMNYAMAAIPRLLEEFIEGDWDFMNTNRRLKSQGAPNSMQHYGNRWLTSVLRRLFPGNPYGDSRSGMWVFRKSILPHLRLRQSGFAFSQEIKIEAFVRGFKCTEVPVSFCPPHSDGGKKLYAAIESIKSLWYIFFKRGEIWMGEDASPRLSDVSPRPRKILLVSHFYLPHMGGVEMVVEKQAKFLAQSGCEVKIVTSDIPSHTGATGISDERISVRRVKAWNGLEKFGIPFPFFSLHLLRVLWQEVGRADLVHIHDVFYFSSHVAALMAWLRRRPLFVTQHVAVVKHLKVVMMVQHLVYALMGKRIFKFAQKIIVYNSHVKHFLFQMGVPEAKVVELRNGIDVELFRPAAREEKIQARRTLGLPLYQPLALFVGRLVPKKGLKEFCAARSEYFDLVVVGSGELPAKFQAERHLHFLGEKRAEALAQVYRAVDVFVFPSHGEVFTLTMQEAMASGLPVITSNESAYDHYDLGKELFMQVPRDPALIREAIIKLIRDKELSDRMGKNARNFALKFFNWQENMRLIWEIYHKT